MHGDISMDLILHTVFSLVISLSPSFADKTSKACYGSAGPPCTKHILTCSPRRIAIKEAFYTNSTACGGGVSDCAKISLSSIPLTGTRYNFSDTELDSLYRNCSTQQTCSHPADRRGPMGTISFSAIIYQCIIATTLRSTRTNASPTTATQRTTRTLGSPRSSESTTGMVVGIIVPLCIIIAGGVIAVIICRRRKLRQKGENLPVAKHKSKQKEVHSVEKKVSPDYDYATTNEYLDLVPKAHNMPAPLKGTSGYDYAGKNTNHEVKPQHISRTSDYDYATCCDQQANHEHPSSMKTQMKDSDYDHIGRQPARANGHCETSAGPKKGINQNEEVYSYNHLNEKASGNTDVDSTYNTTASTRQKLDASSNDMEDHYGYNHLGTELKKNLPQNEYDTTASAIRDVARRNGDMEDSTYDHANLKTSDFSSSGMANAAFQESDYDHASPTSIVHKDEYEFNATQHVSPKVKGKTDAYTLAQEFDSNPYQLAK